MIVNLRGLWASKSTLHGTVWVQSNDGSWYQTLSFHQPLAGMSYTDLKQVVDAIERYWADMGEDGLLF